MPRRILALLVAIFAFALAGTAFTQVDDDRPTEEAEEPKEKAPPADEAEPEPEKAAPAQAPAGAASAEAPDGPKPSSDAPEPSDVAEQIDLPSEPIAYAKMLRDILEKQKPKVLEKIETKQAASQEKKMGRLSSILTWLSLA